MGPEGMDTGTKVSAAGHGGLILWVMLAGLFDASEVPPPVVTEVTLLSAAEFAALEARAAPAPEPAPRPAPRPAPPPPAAALPAARLNQPPRPPQLPAQPNRPPRKPPAPLPPAARPRSARTPAVARTRPPPPPRQFQQPAVPPGRAAAARPRTSPRPARPAAGPPRQWRPHPNPSPNRRPNRRQGEPEPPAGTRPCAPLPAAAPEPPPAAPSLSQTSVRPRARPAQPAPPQITARSPSPRRPGPSPHFGIRAARTLAGPGRRAPAGDPAAAAIADAVAAALAAPAPGPAADSGALTTSEVEALRLAVAQCWQLGAAAAELLETTVVVAFSMTPAGEPVNLRLVSADGATEAANRIAWERAQRAILCARNVALPPEKYDAWREIEMEFNPEAMRIR